MLARYRICGFIRIFAHNELVRVFHSGYVDSTRLGPVKQINHKVKRKFGGSFKSCGKGKKKMVEKEDKNIKVYMRDRVGTVSKILRYSTWDSAQEQLEKLQIRWDSYTINQILKTHPPMEKAWLFFNWASKLKGFKHDQFTYTTMLDIFGEAGRISSMKYVFKQMQENSIKIDAVTYTSTLHWLSEDGDLEGALKMWEEMKANGISPTVVTYTAFMKALFDNSRAKEAIEIYKEMLESGCSPNCYTYTVLMEYLANTGKFREALEILSKMQEAGVQPDKAACNILVQKCSRAGETWATNHVLHFMKENYFVLRHPVYLDALEALRKAGESDKLLREVNPHLSFEGVYMEGTLICETIATDIQTTLDRAIVINFLAKQNTIAVEVMLGEFINKKILLDPKLISAIISANCANHRPTCALSAFNYGIEMGIHIERPACLALVGFFIRNSYFSELVEIVEKMVLAGVPLGTYLLSLVIYKLGCTQMSASSEKLFNALPHNQKNSVTYTALMGAYFSSREVDKGLEIFDTMRKKGIKAAGGTYRVLILGLKEAGRVHEAEKYYKEKKSVQRTYNREEIVSKEENLCDLIFAGDLGSC